MGGGGKLGGGGVLGSLHAMGGILEYRTSVMWNVARQILNLPDTTMSVSVFKNKLKMFLTEKQILGDDINWIDHNFYPF